MTKEETLQKQGAQLAKVLKKITGDDNKVEEFNRLFEKFAAMVFEEKRRRKEAALG